MSNIPYDNLTTITFDDKEAITNIEDISAVNYITADNINNIKNAINSLVTNVSALNEFCFSSQDYVNGTTTNNQTSTNNSKNCNIIHFTDMDGAEQVTGNISVDLSNFVEKDQLIVQSENINDSIKTLDNIYLSIDKFNIDGSPVIPTKEYNLVSKDVIDEYFDSHNKAYFDTLKYYLKSNRYITQDALDEFKNTACSSIVLNSASNPLRYNVNINDRTIYIDKIPSSIIEGFSGGSGSGGGTGSIFNEIYDYIDSHDTNITNNINILSSSLNNQENPSYFNHNHKTDEITFNAVDDYYSISDVGSAEQRATANLSDTNRVSISQNTVLTQKIAELNAKVDALCKVLEHHTHPAADIPDITSQIITVVTDSIPKGAIIFLAPGQTPVDTETWHICDGNNGTPNLNDRWIRCTTNSSLAGTTLQAGIPNLYGTARFNTWHNFCSAGGCFVQTNFASGSGLEHCGSDTYADLIFNAHNYNSIYGNSNTVQPPSMYLIPWMKIK